MKTSEMRNKTVSDLKVELKKAYEELFKLNMQKGRQKLTNVHLLKQVRKGIARLRTIIREQEVRG